MMLRIPPPRSREASREWARAQAGVSTSDELFLAIASFKTNDALGHLSTSQTDRRNATFSYGLALFCPHWRKGYGNDEALYGMTAQEFAERWARSER